MREQKLITLTSEAKDVAGDIPNFSHWVEERIWEYHKKNGEKD